MSAATITLEVASRFDALRRRYLLVRVATVLAAAAAVLVAAWLALAAADYVWEWPRTLRRPLAIAAGSAIAAAVVSATYRAGREASTRRFVAAFESRFDQFGQRMRTVLDIARGRSAGAQSMVNALANQTLGRWETVDVGQIVPRRRLTVSVSAAAALLALAAGVWAFGGEAGIAMRRAVGIDLPYTTLRVTPGDAIILEGQPAVVRLELLGRGGREVSVRYRSLPAKTNTAPGADAAAGADADAAWVEVGLQPDEQADDAASKGISGSRSDAAATYSLSLGRMVGPIEYRYVTSVGDTRVYRLDVRPLIRADAVSTKVRPPEYTRLEERTYQSRELTVLRGSQVEVRVGTSHPLRSMRLRMGPKANRLADVPAESAPRSGDGTNWVFTLPAENSIHWRLDGVGDLDTPMTPVRGRLRVRADDPPKLAWQEPADQVKVHTLAEVPLRLQVSDDYGVTAASIAFQLGDEEFVLAEFDPAAGGEGDELNTKVDLSEILPLETLGLTERDYITYYAFATDNRGDAPQRAESDLRYIDIRPLRQFYSEIELDLNNLNNGGRRLRAQLDEIIRRERFVINRTRQLPQGGQSLSPMQLSTVDTLVAGQSELAGLTRDLADFLVSRGNDDVEALNQAEASMLQAADALGAANFPLAMTQEQDALRSLAEARRTLELFLIKNPSPEQQLALRRFALQLEQKLRRQRPQSAQQLVDSLESLAREQRQLGELAASIAKRGVEGGGLESESEAEAAPPPAEGEAVDGETAARPPENAQEVRSRQIELLERLEAIDTALRGDPARTELFDARMEEAVTEMDRLAGLARENALGPFAEAAPPLADLLNELAEQLEALTAVEPVERVAALRNMVTSLANMEQRRSQRRGSQASSNMAGRNGSGGSGERGQNSGRGQADARAPRPNENEDARVENDQTGDGRGEGQRMNGQSGGEPDEQYPDGERDGGDRDEERMTGEGGVVVSGEEQPDEQRGGESTAERQPGGGEEEDSPPTDADDPTAAAIALRTATVRDVLQMPAALGDVQTSEINEELQRFAEENEIFDLLEASRAATGTEQGAAMRRATDYAQAAFQLDELYRRSVAPQLSRLRRLEQQASQLAARMNGNGKSSNPQPSGGGRGGEDPDSQPSDAAGVGQLRKSLEDEGLDEIAELLEGGGGGQSDRPIGVGTDDLDSRSATSDMGNVWSITTEGSPGQRVQVVAARLRERIQELMLRELAADRDAPVPTQYREAVDRYFRSLTAGEDQ